MTIRGMSETYNIFSVIHIIIITRCLLHCLEN